MTSKERDVIRAIIGALHVPRDRLGRLDSCHGREATEAMREYGLAVGLPHGGVDRIDKACMILQALVGDPVTSVREF